MAKKILLVDDEQDLLKGMQIRLASWGYEVLTAVNGKEAIRLVKKEKPDAIVLDIMMPQMDGMEALRQIRKFDKKVAVFMLTAYGSTKDFAETEDLGISGFIHKGTKLSASASELIHEVLQGSGDR